jgi:SAM-dependent methyltransferase
MEPLTNLSWTGERFVPHISGETALEHFHRYALAQILAPGKRVLDVACGEGYGSGLLAEKAASVVGIDIDANVVTHAHNKYSRDNLVFRQGECDALPLADGSIDLAVSFETLEHHDKHDAMLRELRRILAPDGVLLISTPDKYYYSDERHYINPFHAKELYADEFRRLIQRYFPYTAFYGQRVIYGSLITPFDINAPFISFSAENPESAQSSGLAAPLYLLAVASASSLPRIPSSLFDGTCAWEDRNQLLLQELAEAKDQLARIHFQLTSVYESIYWRITSPLRFLRNIVKRTLGI